MLITGLLTFTLYQRNAPPRVWLCGVEERSGSDLMAVYRPFGANSESDVHISQLSIQRTGGFLTAVNSVAVKCTCDGRYAIDAQLQGMERRQGMGTHGMWSGVFNTGDGQFTVLVIKLFSLFSTRCVLRRYRDCCIMTAATARNISIFLLLVSGITLSLLTRCQTVESGTTHRARCGTHQCHSPSIARPTNSYDVRDY